MKKRLILKGCSVLVMCVVLAFSVFVGISAAKSLDFNIGLRFLPDYFCKVEVKTSAEEYITIFNNHDLSAVHEDYISKIENNTLHLDLPELQSAIGATLIFRVTNYTQTMAISATVTSFNAEQTVLNTSNIKKINKYDATSAAPSAETSISIAAGALLTISFATYIAVMCDLINTGDDCVFTIGKGSFFRADTLEIFFPGEKVLELNELFYFVSLCSGGGGKNYYARLNNVSGGTISGTFTTNSQFIEAGGNPDFYNKYASMFYPFYPWFNICTVTSQVMQVEVFNTWMPG